MRPTAQHQTFTLVIAILSLYEPQNFLLIHSAVVACNVDHKGYVLYLDQAIGQFQKRLASNIVLKGGHGEHVNITDAISETVVMLGIVICTDRLLMIIAH